jgi:ferredoxin-NADP reductase
MREKKGGAVTGALLGIVRERAQDRPGEMVDVNELKVDAGVVGVTGDFFMDRGEVKMLWVAGGIGVTPFLAMFSALVERGPEAQGDIVLALATREPKVFLELIRYYLTKSLPNVRIRIDMFTSEPDPPHNDLKDVNAEIIVHKGRIQPSYWTEVAEGRDVLICGPGGFGDAAVDGLRAVGVPNSKILREGFY